MMVPSSASRAGADNLKGLHTSLGPIKSHLGVPPRQDPSCFFWQLIDHRPMDNVRKIVAYLSLSSRSELPIYFRRSLRIFTCIVFTDFTWALSAITEGCHNCCFLSESVFSISA